MDHANRTNTDLQKALKRLQQNVAELQAQVEHEQQQRDEAREAAISAERRANLIVGELEELRTALEQAERARKAAETELHEAADRISEVSTQNATLSSQRRQLESTVTAMQSDLDEAVSELRNIEERCKKSGKSISKLDFLFFLTNKVFQKPIRLVLLKNYVVNKNIRSMSNDYVKVLNNKLKIFNHVSMKLKAMYSKVANVLLLNLNNV